MELWNEGYENLVRLLPEFVADAERKFPYASITLTVEAALSLTLDGDQPAVSVPPDDTGITVTLFDGRCIREYGSNDLRSEPLTKTIRQMISDTPVFEPEFTILHPPPAAAEYSLTMDRDPLQVPLAEKLAAMRQVRELALKEELIKHTTVNYGERRWIKVFAGRDRLLRQEVSTLAASYTVYASNGGQTQYCRKGNTGAGGFELLGQYYEPSGIKETTDRAKSLLKAESVPPGYHTLLTAPLISSVIAHEAFGHGVEVDMFLKECARAREFIGKPVAAPIVNMVDHARGQPSSGFYFFDDEGLEARPTQIIKDGVLLSGITDLYSASRLGLPRTPNGRRESFRRKIYSRMSNTFIEPGRSSAEDMLKGIDRGIYLFDGGSGMEDPLGWGIQIDVHAGEEIRNGALTGKVYSPIVLTGYVPDLLKSISAISTEYGIFGLGRCGKTFRKDWILVGCGSPYLSLEGRLT